MGFHQARVGKTANSLLKDGAKIHPKNDRKIIRPKGLKSGTEMDPNRLQGENPPKTSQ
jgi:hypothetical protein